MPKAYEKELKDIVERDPLHPLYEQDRELIWRFRYCILYTLMHDINICRVCRMHLIEIPSSLPKLLSAVKWSHHKDVALVSMIHTNVVCS